jgi:hypothetical protein
MIHTNKTKLSNAQQAIDALNETYKAVASELTTRLPVVSDNRKNYIEGKLSGIAQAYAIVREAFKTEL